MADLLGLRRGTLRVGVTHSFSTALIPRAVASFRREHPGVSVVIEKTSGRAIEQGAGRRHARPGDRLRPARVARVEAETLFEEEVVLIVAAATAWRAATGWSSPSSTGSRWSCQPRVRDPPAARRTPAGGRVQPEIAVEMNDIDSLLEIVRLGTGATVLSRRAVTDPRAWCSCRSPSRG